MVRKHFATPKIREMGLHSPLKYKRIQPSPTINRTIVFIHDAKFAVLIQKTLEGQNKAYYLVNTSLTPAQSLCLKEIKVELK